MWRTPFPLVFVWKRWIVQNFWCCCTGYSIVSSKGWKGRPCKEFERRKRKRSKIRRKRYSMHVLVIPLKSVDSVWYPVFAPDCKQHMGFFTLPLCSSHFGQMLHVIESHESTLMIDNPVRFGSKPHRKVDWLKSVRNRFDWNQFKYRKNGSGSVWIDSGSKPNYFASVKGLYVFLTHK